MKELFEWLIIKYKEYLNRFLSKIRKKKEQDTLDHQLDKYIAEEQKDVMKVKLDKISKIIADTEDHIEKSVMERVKAAAEQEKIREKD